MATLDTIINEVMLGARDKDSLIFGKGKPLVVLTAKRCLQELYFSVAGQVRILAFDVPESGILDIPEDYVTLVRLSVLTCDNKLRALYFDARKPIQYEYLRTGTGSLILDPKTGLPLKSYTKTENDSCQSFDFEYNYDYSRRNIGYGQLYGMRGGYKNSAGLFRWEPEARKFYLEDISEDTNKIFIEYVSNPLARNDNDTLEVDELFVECLKSGIVYELIKNDRSMPMGRIQMAERNYYKLKKKARMRSQMNAEQLKQASRTQRGSYKF